MSQGSNSRDAFKQPFADLAASVELGLIRTLDAERQEAEQGLQARRDSDGPFRRAGALGVVSAEL